MAVFLLNTAASVTLKQLVNNMKKIIFALISVVSIIIATLSVNAYTQEEIPVIFTSDSKAVEGGKLTVDIRAMTDYDATIYNAWLEGDVNYEWHKDDIIVLENTTNTYEFTSEDVGHEFYVLVNCWDYTMKSENITVAAANEPTDPVILTKSIPEAVAGEEYYAKIECADPDATFGIYYNPGRDNEFEKTGLILSESGEITGVPTKEGKYGFTVASYGEAGEGYVVLELVVFASTDDESSQDSSGVADESEEQSAEASADESTENSEEDSAPTLSEAESLTVSEVESKGSASGESDTEKSAMPWWSLVIVAVAALAVGVGVTLAVVKKKK